MLETNCEHALSVAESGRSGRVVVMNRTRATVADLRAAKGKRQMTMVYVRDVDEARACAAAGIDVLSIEQPYWSPEMREAAGDCFVQVGLPYGQLATTDDYLRAGHAAIQSEGDCCWCAASTEVIARLSAEGIPIVGHVGLIPSRRTWTGGFKAVGKTLDTAKLVWEQVRALEDAGAFAAEIEVVPAEITAEIATRTSLVLFSMGAGTGADAQYLFAEDILGYTPGHRPRHAKVYRDFAAELDRLQHERIAAFAEFRADVESGAYPEPHHLVPVDAEVRDRFVEFLDGAR
jgi:3-methyl-2-oxobutanoate hydroxymethyltransferase